jgi:hypothetical protein
MDDRILRKAILKTEEEHSGDSEFETAQTEAVEVASELAPPLSEAQKDMLDRLSAWAEKSSHREDSKAKAILDWLSVHIKVDTQWSDKRVILFTEYRATHTWLQQILASKGYGGEHLMYLHGDMLPKEREKVKAAFQASPDVSPVRILLATDAASEGIDLQNHCNYLIHVEIPWNPNVMEQRNGRIDRHGQKESVVHIWHPVGKDFSPTTIDLTMRPGDIVGENEYLMRAVLKIDTIREDLGSVGPVIAKQIEEAMLGKRIGMDTTEAEGKAAKTRKFMSEEKRIRERVARLHETLLETKEDFHLSPEHIYRAVKVALEIAEKPPLIPLAAPNGKSDSVFEAPILSGSWGRSLAGLEHPHTRVRRPVTFDHDTAKGRDDVVLAHLNHRLVQMCLRLLREEIWKLDDVKHLHRVTVRSIPDGELNSPVVLVWSRLVIIGGDHHRLHEELTLSGGELKHDGFSRISHIGKLETLLEHSFPCDPGTSLFGILRDRFERRHDPLMATVEARSKERMKYLENTLEKRKGSETADILSILDELEASIRKELKPDETQQCRQLYLSGFSPEETAQVKKDIQALETRLERIPSERKDEKAAIERHYSNPVDRTFPAAVVFLVPESQTRKV